MRNRPHAITFAAAAVVTAVTIAAPTSAIATTRTLSAPQVRVNQVGYPSSGSKVAYVMLPAKVARVSFEVTTRYGVAYRGSSTDDVGSWNAAYQAVYQLSFSGVRAPGRYQVKVTSPAAGASPAFTIGDGSQLYRQLVNNAVQYFTSERDGPDVDSAVLGRQPTLEACAWVWNDVQLQRSGPLHLKAGTLATSPGCRIRLWPSAQTWTVPRTHRK